MQAISVSAHISAPIEKVWDFWNTPEHIMQWYHASDDWHVPHAENNPVAGGEFSFGMAARDGSENFDFEGTYTGVILNELIEYIILDGRKVVVTFDEVGGWVSITETFETEDINAVELQREGWQSILDNFKKYAENREAE